MKKFYVEYLEDSPPGGLVDSTSPVLRVTHHFTKGPCVGPNCGFKRKRDMLYACERINQTTGRETVRPYTP